MYHGSQRNRSTDRPSKENKVDTSVKVGSITSKFHMFKKHLTGGSSTDELDNSFYDDLNRFRELRKRLPHLPHTANQFFEKMREATKAAYDLSREVQKFTVDHDSLNNVGLGSLGSAQQKLFSAVAEQKCALGCQRPVDTFTDELDLGIPSIESLIIDRKDKYAVYSLYKHKLDKACKAARRAREKTRMLAWKSASSLEDEVVRKQGQFENAKALFDTADTKLNAEIAALKSRQCVMVATILHALVDMHRNMSKNGIELMYVFSMNFKNVFS